MAQMEAQMAHKYEHSMMQAAATAADPSATDYSQYWQSQYGQNWSQYAAWSQYYQQYYDPSQANAAYYGWVFHQFGSVYSKIKSSLRSHFLKHYIIFFL